MATLPPEFTRASEAFGDVYELRAGCEWETLCPAHDDHKRSLWIKRGDRGLVLACRAGCRTPDIVHAAGLAMTDLFPPKEKTMTEPKQLDHVYTYTDADGKMLFQVCRWKPKGFSQRRRPVPSDPPERIKRGWVWTREDVPYVLYRLPEVITAKTIILVEGEKDADRVASLKIKGVAATTAPMGAGEWRDEYTAALVGKRVIILPDNDDPGRKHASDVAAALVGKAASVRIVELPDLPPKGDASDWLDAGRTRDDLIEALKGGATCQKQQVTTDGLGPADALMLAAVAVAGVQDSRRAADRLAAFLRSKGVLA